MPTINILAELEPVPFPRPASNGRRQDADIVMFLYREDYYDRDTDNKGIAQVIIAKNRNGATGATALFFKPKIVCFFNATKVED